MATAKERIQDELAKGRNLSIITLVDALVAHAYESHASDIHIDPVAECVAVRMRVDGVLQDTFTLPKDIYMEVIGRIKVLAGLRTDEHQAAQDGRFRMSLGDDRGSVDIRVSIVPTYHGENAVLRLLVDKAEQYTFEALGYRPKEAEKIAKAIKRPHGMILCTGPTGSGKTTTLYAMLKLLNTKDISIITIEDPVEYAIPGITQIQVNARHGLTFASGLRSILRQDPNIIMVGEIRDAETAGIAVNTALTGHLLLSTLHTSDAATTLPRLLDMGIESYLVASTVNVAIAQRLVRKICTKCKEKKPITDAERQSLADILPKERVDALPAFYVGAGCEECHNTGYRGRISINEILVVDDAVREVILHKGSASALKKAAAANGMTTMVEDGLLKAAEGTTSVDEVLRVVYE